MHCELSAAVDNHAIDNVTAHVLTVSFVPPASSDTLHTVE